ncbi:MAG: hypothetical protein AB2404_14975 [Planifilum fimeticola]
MTFSQEIKDKMVQFAKEQSQYYLDEAEMTYLEKLRRKTGQTQSKIAAKLAKFKGRSETALEAQNDLLLYMSDYMKDLMEKGLSEEEAFERAKEELEYRSESERSADLHERFARYYENRDPAEYEAIGLFYAGFLFFGVSIGALIGYLGGGGREVFLTDGWIDTAIGAAVGAVIGLGAGLISNAVIVLKKK